MALCIPASLALSPCRRTIPLIRVTPNLSMQVEEESRGGQDPLGVSSAPASATLYPLRSTGESDGVGLREWGLLREGVRVYAVFYATRYVLKDAVLRMGFLKAIFKARLLHD